MQPEFNDPFADEITPGTATLETETPRYTSESGLCGWCNEPGDEQRPLEQHGTNGSGLPFFAHRDCDMRETVGPEFEGATGGDPFALPA